MNGTERLAIALAVTMMLAGCYRTTDDKSWSGIFGSQRADFAGADYEDVWQECLLTLASLDIPVETAEVEQGRITSEKIRDDKAYWRLNINVARQRDGVSVYVFTDARFGTLKESWLTGSQEGLKERYRERDRRMYGNGSNFIWELDARLKGKGAEEQFSDLPPAD